MDFFLLLDTNNEMSLLESKMIKLQVSVHSFYSVNSARREKWHYKQVVEKTNH